MPPRRRTRRTPRRPVPRPRTRTSGAGKRKDAKPAIPIPENWTLDPDGRSISRQLKTKDFVEAVDIINEVRDLAEALQHHPDLHLERWNRLRVTTYSHDVGRLTERDERLAKGINDLLAKRGAFAPR